MRPIKVILTFLTLLLGGAAVAATSTEDVLQTLSGIGKTVYSVADNGAIQASIAVEDLPPLTAPPSTLPGTAAIPSRLIAEWDDDWRGQGNAVRILDVISQPRRAKVQDYEYDGGSASGLSRSHA